MPKLNLLSISILAYPVAASHHRQGKVCSYVIMYLTNQRTIGKSYCINNKQIHVPTLQSADVSIRIRIRIGKNKYQ